MNHETDPEFLFYQGLLDSVRVREPWERELLRPCEFRLDLPYEIWQKLKWLPKRDGCESMVDPIHLHKAILIYLEILDRAKGLGAKE